MIRSFFSWKLMLAASVLFLADPTSRTRADEPADNPPGKKAGDPGKKAPGKDGDPASPGKKSPGKEGDPASPGKKNPKDGDGDDGIDKDLRKAVRDLNRQLRDLQRQVQQMNPRMPAMPIMPAMPMIPGMPNGKLRMRVGGRGFGGLNPFGGNEQDDCERLGATIEKPSAVLVAQLDLPRDQGIVLEEVQANSAAAKAGLKTHDILLELNGKPVPSDLDEFEKLIDGIKAKTPVDAVVVRKGKKETIKGITLAEAQPGAGKVFQGKGMQFGPGGIVIGGGRGGFGGAIIPFPAVPFPNGGNGGDSGFSIQRNADGNFTTNYKEGNIAIRITGKLADGKATVEEIEIKDGKRSRTFKSVAEVPDEFRNDVKFMIQRTERGK